jgi:hypothetical protein
MRLAHLAHDDREHKTRLNSADCEHGYIREMAAFGSFAMIQGENAKAGLGQGILDLWNTRKDQNLNVSRRSPSSLKVFPL